MKKAIEFIDNLTLPDGSYPDFGDRDDGFVFRIDGTYDESPFPGLLIVAAYFFERPEWLRGTPAVTNALSSGPGNSLKIFKDNIQGTPFLHIQKHRSDKHIPMAV